MEQHDVSWWVAFGVGAVAASLIVGALLGLIPLVLGQFLAQVRLGRIAFLVTVIGGFLGGMFLALPSCIGFVIAVLVRWRRQRPAPTQGSGDAA
jgi:hypothetical protein